MAGIKVKGLTKSYVLPDRTHIVLQGINLTMEDEGITVVVGKSGCGKTTLLRLLAGLELPDGGEILMPPGRPGMVFQEPRLMPWLTVRDNITFGLEKKEISPERTKELTELVGLSGFEQAYPSQLSGGMQQRAAIARVLACDPPVILMDEPFAALDFFTRQAMQQELLRIVEQSGKQVMFVTHSIDEALTLGKQIVVLEEGRISKSYDLSQIPQPRDLLQEQLTHMKKDILSHIRQGS